MPVPVPLRYHCGMAKLWFRAKRYGYGWTPATWQGWLVVGIAIFLYLVPSGLLLIFGPEALSAETFLALCLPWYVGITIVLIWISAKTGEPLRWRWGGR
jgi:hypothetical protein